MVNSHPIALSHGELSPYSSFILFILLFCLSSFVRFVSLLVLFFFFCFVFLTTFRSYCFALENYHLWDSIENGKEMPVARLRPL